MQRLIALALVLLFASPAFAKDDLSVCREYGYNWKPLRDTPLHAHVVHEGVPHAPNGRVVVCVGGGPVAGRLARSDLIEDYDKHGKPTVEGWSIGLHQTLLDTAPDDLLHAIVMHEVGHQALGHYYTCVLKIWADDIGGYAICEYVVDLWASERVGHCTMSRALRFVDELLLRHGVPRVHPNMLRSELVHKSPLVAHCEN